MGKWPSRQKPLQVLALQELLERFLAFVSTATLLHCHTLGSHVPDIPEQWLQVVSWRLSSVCGSQKHLHAQATDICSMSVMAQPQPSLPADIETPSSSSMQWRIHVILFVLSYFLSHLLKMMQESNNHRSASPVCLLPHPTLHAGRSSWRALELWRFPTSTPSPTQLLAFVLQKKQREGK